MLGKMYPSWVERTLNGTETYTTGTFKALLLKSSYTYSNTHVFVSDLTPATNEITGVTYPRVTLAGLAISRTLTVTKVVFNPITFSLVTATGTGAPKYMAIFKVGAADASSSLVLIQDFETTLDLNTEDMTITPSSAGFLRYTSSP